MKNTLTRNLYITVSKTDEHATIHLDGHFTFASHVKFKEAYSQLIEDCIIRTITVDFARVERLDSAALGMLLMLRDRIGHIGKKLMLGRRSPIVEKTFDVANFHRIFTIAAHD